MLYLITKYLITAAVVVLVSEFAKSSDKLGGLVAALPLVTVLTLIWLYVEHQPATKIANHAYYTFWYVIPTLPMFLLFPYLLPKLGFWLTLMACIVFTLMVFYVYAIVLKQFGINLL
jgi:F0F1-type ATP synthase assembly protein I